ncbi:putative hsp70 protein [Metarhizium acridum CQMa 102]|uniref:Putative hsp70 protein n=1 Tax=Metarhizium acridum (strain CQMa 102) TaxID=655827 RepID=E9DZZ4_METAQ|nr:putative hsp70 protein [Metarhizium acridum CQMa 102]EFY90829.1 putative hsp70 protein [Metarhizium acridum CQMa 102]
MDEYIIIGIDFGTTYSGVAWAYSNEPEDIEVVTTWESELNHCSDLEKTPTHLYFGKGDGNIKWGYNIPENGEALEWFKLLLLKEKDLPLDVRHSPKLDEARRLQELSKRDVVDIVACFLTRLWKHALRSIKEANGDNLLEKCRLHVVMTLPAIWPHYAQEKMRNAAEKAGFFRKRSFQEINYPGKGQIKKFLNDNWEHGIKPQFRGQNRSWGVELPNSVLAKGKGKKRPSTLEISTSELIDVFSPIVGKVESLVTHQSMSIVGKYGREPKFVILVGGFGRSPYLFERLKLLVGENTTVLQSRGSKPSNSFTFYSRTFTNDVYQLGRNMSWSSDSCNHILGLV